MRSLRGLAPAGSASYLGRMSDADSARSVPPWQRYRPRGTGDLLDCSLALLRRRFVHIFAISLVLQLVEYLTGTWTGQGATLSGQLAELTDSFTDLSDSSSLLGMVLIAVTMLMGELTLAVVALFVAADVDGRELDAAMAARQLFERLAPLLWTLAVLGALFFGLLLVGGLALAGFVALASMAGPIAGVVVMAVGGLVLLGLATAVMLRVALTPVVAVIERSRGMAAVLRSWRLVGHTGASGWLNNNRMRIALIYTVIVLLSWGVTALASLPALGLQFAGLLGAEEAELAGAAPLLLRMVLELIEVVGKAAVGPFGALALAYFYFDLRARNEGLDLLLSARFIAARRSEAAP